MLTGQRVVICDEAVPAWQFKREFESHGLRVIGIARDGLEAVEMALKERPDIMLLSAEAEKLDGVEVVRRIARHYLPCILMFVDQPGSQTVREAMEAGVAGCLGKPVAAAEVFRTLERLCDRPKSPP